MKNKFSIAMSLAVILAMVVTAVVLADDVVNNADANVDATYEIISLVTGGQSRQVDLYTVNRNGDGKNGCNLTGSTTLVLNVTSTYPDVATVEPSQITFTACEAENANATTAVTVKSVSAGSTDIEFTLVSNNSGGSFNLDTARFKVEVTLPPNTPPVVSVTGVTGGADYEIGTVPAASCSITDAEDGPQSVLPVIGTINGPLSDYGLGSQEITCSYTDAGGLTTTASATYSIIDTQGPEITLFSRTPYSANEWNNGNVTVVWSCSDTGSGVVDATVSQVVSVEGANQQVIGTCADHAGNTNTNTVTGINIDLQAPTINFSAHPLPNGAGWNNGDVTVSYSCVDNGLSGVDAAASDLSDDVLTSSGTATGACVDMAGNLDSISYEAQVDKDAPEFNCSVPADVWYGANVDVACTASDAGSGLISLLDGNFTLSTNVVDGTETNSAQTGTKTLTDNAGNSTIVGPFTFKVDRKDPEVSCENADSVWHNDNQSVSCSATDGGSGPASQNITLSTDVAAGSETDIAATNSHEFSDAVGNTVTAGPVGPFKIDRKAPSVSATPDRAADFNDWYNHALTVTFTASDGGSGVASCESPVDYSSPDDDSASVSGSCADNVGNSASASFDFKYDATAPTAALSVVAGTEGSNGWYTSNVTVHTSGTGSVSGVTCTNDQFQNAETMGTTFNGSCTSGAGLTTNAAALTVKLDKSAPVNVVLTPSGTLGNNDWYISNVNITTSGTENISTPIVCTAPQSQTADTDGATFNGSCTNDAGLKTEAVALTIKRDATAPSISVAVSPARPASGWWNTASGAPTATYTCTDATSLIASCTAPSIFGEGANQTHNGTAVDNAGNSASTGVNDIDVDLTAPTLTWSGGPANGGSYDFGYVPAAPTCTAADTLSGPNGCSVNGHSNGVGMHTMTATATDMAGNQYSQNRSYSVLGWTLRGFYQPVDMNNVYNIVRNGSTVPLKFEVFTQMSGVEITDTSFVDLLTYAQVSCSLTSNEDLIETVATGGTVLRYDTTSGQFIFNWKTPSGTAGKCFRVTMVADDGSSLVAFFKMK